jgi:hypothetical protein
MPTENFINNIDHYIESACNIYGGEYYHAEQQEEYFEWHNIILLALSWIFICSFLDYLLTPIGSVDNRLNGRYRYLCRGTTANKKRCKRRIYNMPTCHQHVGIQEE